MLKHKIKNEEGSGLILTLMVLLVLSVLGVSVATVTMGSNRLGHATQDSNSAYYIAEAGANMAYEEIRKGVIQAYADNNESGVDKVIGKVKDQSPYNDFEMQSGHQPEAHVSVSEPETEGNKKTYTITSTGKIGLSSRTVTKEFKVNWKKTPTGGGLIIPELPERASVLAKSSINFRGGNLNDNVYLYSKEASAFQLHNNGPQLPDKIFSNYLGDKEKIFNFGDIVTSGNTWLKNSFLSIVDQKRINYDWDTLENSIINLFGSVKNINITNTLNDLPQPPNIGFDIYDNGNLMMTKRVKDGTYELSLEKNIYIPKIEITGDQTLKINTNDKDLIIEVDNFIHKGNNIQILGEGSVSFYINSSIEFGNNNSLNRNGNPNKLNLYYLSENPLTFEGLGSIYGNIFVSDAVVAAVSSTNTVLFNGNFIMGNNSALTLNNIGWSSYLHILAPFSKVYIGTGNYIGSIVSDSLDFANSGGVLSYAPANFESIFPGTPPSISDNPTEDLITSDPAIEN